MTSPAPEALRLAERPRHETHAAGAEAKRLPLATAQFEVWQDHRAHPDEAHLTIGGRGFFHGPVDLDLVIAAARGLAAECAALRLVIDPKSGEQRLLARVDPVVIYKDFSCDADPVDATRRFWQRSASRPIPLDGQRPPWYLALSKVSETLYGLMPLFHHAVMDGYGSSVFIPRLADHYNALRDGTPLPPIMDAGYEAFIAECQDYEDSPAEARDRTYWRTVFADLPPPLSPPLPTATASASGRLPPARLANLPMPRTLLHTVEEAARGLGATPFHLCLAALAVVLAEHFGQDDLVIAVPTLNRAGRTYRDTLGLFVGLLPLRIRVDGRATPVDLLRAIGRDLRAAYRHRRLPLTRLGQDLELLGQGRERLFDVVFSFEILNYACALGDAPLHEARQLFSGTARYPLGVTICDFLPGEDLDLNVEASADHFDADMPQRLGNRLLHVIHQITMAPDQPLTSLDLLPAAEHDALRRLEHGPLFPTPPPLVSAAIRRACLSHGDRVAIRWAGGTWTHLRLAARTAAIAAALRRRGVGPGAVVAFCLPPCPDLVAAMLAIMDCRAAFLPIDGDAPVAYRLARLKDAAATLLLLADGRDGEVLKANTETATLRLDHVSDDDGAAAEENEPADDDIAYVLHTSGSTGTPKGVRVPQRALATRLHDIAEAWEVGPEDCGGVLARPTFDPSLIALLMPLTRGGSVALPPEWRLTTKALSDFLSRHPITLAPLVPATVGQVIEAIRPIPPRKRHLRVACCGGEVLPPALARTFIGETGARLDNVYGPTEATILATRWVCDTAAPAPTSLPLPIGRPVAETVVRLLTPEGRPVPLGAKGEICIGGGGLARGYLGRPDLTAEKFILDPFGDGHLYRTGDLGSWGADGALRFFGRLDRQIKLNGQRIEPGEIEALLCSLPEVSAAVVDVVRHDDPAVQDGRTAAHLHAWVVSRTTAPQALAARLLTLVADHLPLQMSLGDLTVMPSAPLTPSGKIDVAALPRPRQGPARDADDDAAQTPLERELAGLWADALSCPGVALHDNLFALGADSLAAMHVLVGLETELGVALPLALLLRHPTVAGQVRALGEALSHEAVPLCRRPADRSEAAAPIVFLTASGHGDALRFQTLAKALGATCDVFMLQPPSLDGSDDPPDFRTLGTTYAGRIRDVCADRPEAPVVIAGFSLGGVAALETARALRSSDRPAASTILIDTTYPFRSTIGERSWRRVASLIRSLRLHRWHRPSWRLIAMLDDQGLSWQLRALRQYRPAPFHGEVDLVVSSGMRFFGPFLFAPWRHVLKGRLRRHSVRGLHGTILRPGRVQSLAALLHGLASARPDR